MAEEVDIKGTRAEVRTVSMYPGEWEAVDLAATRRGIVTARGPNTSQMLRQIIREWAQAAGDELRGEPESGDHA